MEGRGAGLDKKNVFVNVFTEGVFEPADLFLLHQHEQQMEGVLLNDLLPVDGRLEPVPVPVTVLQLAEMVHADRAFVSRILSKWREAGCFEREARRLLFSRAVLDTF